MVEASVRVHGRYNNGNGATLGRYVHELLKRAVETGDNTPAEFTQKLASILPRIKKPSDELKEELRTKSNNSDLEFDGRWGYHGMRRAGQAILEEEELVPNLIAGIATSSLSPAWVQTASIEDVRTHATAILLAREICGHFHMLDLWVVNSD